MAVLMTVLIGSFLIAGAGILVLLAAWAFRALPCRVKRQVALGISVIALTLFFLLASVLASTIASGNDTELVVPHIVFLSLAGAVFVLGLRYYRRHKHEDGRLIRPLFDVRFL
jgi:uncharacterized membrane protein